MKKIVICGLSNRGIHMFLKPLMRDFRGAASLVGLLDIDPRRFEVAVETEPLAKNVPFYEGEDEFDRMIRETGADTVIVASMDCTHVRYILRALEKNLDVISEKPMVTTAEDCRRVLAAEKKSKGKVTVTFNYRYAPAHRRVKELVLEGKVGRITSVDLNWYIDTYHGASYFNRWNRMRENSGGLSIHKCTHHFDLINWWIDQKPVEVFAYGALNFFGPNGETNPSRQDGRRCGTCAQREDCIYKMRWEPRVGKAVIIDDHLGTVISSKPPYTGYQPDRCIFDSQINIEDTYVVSARYDQGAFLSYSVCFSAPYEGLRLAINGTKGRIELTEYDTAGTPRLPFEAPPYTLDYLPLFGYGRERIDVLPGIGGHGGGDGVILAELFLGKDRHSAYDISAGALDGAYTVCTGEAVWRSVREKRPIKLSELLHGAL